MSSDLPERDPERSRPLNAAPSGPTARELGLLFACAAAGWGTGCANESPPPGMLPDSRPPAVAEISPAPDTVIPDFNGRVEVRFDEPVNVGRSMNQQLNASPAGRYEVQVGFSNVRIRPRDEWLVRITRRSL